MSFIRAYGINSFLICSFPSKVLALVEHPRLIEVAPNAFSKDALDRARRHLASIPRSTGAYTSSQGLNHVTKAVAKFIERRDGIPSDPTSIFLSDGATPAIQKTLQLLLGDKNDGILTPIPQYPLYSASISLLGGRQVGYYLKEARDWGLDVRSAVSLLIVMIRLFPHDCRCCFVVLFSLR